MWPWQEQALTAWEGNGRRGIVTAPTGSGKTRLALAAITRFWSQQARVLIIVPTIALQEQWKRELERSLSIPESRIGLVGGARNQLSYSQEFVISVINTARVAAESLVASWSSENRPVLLVIDECHWAASGSNAAIFNRPVDATLGLSATPERSDDGLERVLIPAIGPVVFSYSLRQGLDDGLLAPLRCINLFFDLDELDRHQLEPVQASIDAIENPLLSATGELQSKSALEIEVGLTKLTRGSTEGSRLTDLYRQRAAILEGAPARRLLLDAVCSSEFVRSARCLLFHERIAEASITAERLINAGVPTAVDSSLDDPEHRTRELRAFKSGRATALVAVRTLDEGIDVPEAKRAIIAAGSSSVRQRIQRIGRVIRRTGEPATVISLLARNTSEEWRVGFHDSSIVGHERVVHHRWPKRSIAECLAEPEPSTYYPTPHGRS